MIGKLEFDDTGGDDIMIGRYSGKSADCLMTMLDAENHSYVILLATLRSFELSETGEMQ
jgi:hypothetical protein